MRHIWNSYMRHTVRLTRKNLFPRDPAEKSQRGLKKIVRRVARTSAVPRGIYIAVRGERGLPKKTALDDRQRGSAVDHRGLPRTSATDYRGLLQYKGGVSAE